MLYKFNNTLPKLILKTGLTNLSHRLRMTTIKSEGGLKLLFFRSALYLNGVPLAHNLFRTTLHHVMFFVKKQEAW